MAWVIAYVVAKKKITPDRLAKQYSLAWEVARGAAKFEADPDGPNGIIAFPDEYANAAISGVLQEETDLFGRWVDVANTYVCKLDRVAATEDFRLAKIVARATTILAAEAVDFATESTHLVKFEVVGTELRGYREDLTAPVITATDTEFASGLWGLRVVGSFDSPRPSVHGADSLTLALPSSKPPKTLAYFEVPVVGSGTEGDPFRPRMPEDVVEDPKLGRVNRLQLTYGSVIKVGRRTGRPIDYVAIIRILEQPRRPEYLEPVAKCLDALRAMPGVREFSRNDAIKRAIELDGKLAPKDFASW